MNYKLQQTAMISVAEKLKEEITLADVNVMRKRFHVIPFSDWERGLSDPFALEFTKATELQRLQKVEFFNHRAFLLLSAYTHHMLAAAMYAILAQYEYSLNAPGTYAENGAIWAEAFLKLVNSRKREWYWPFPNWPFEESVIFPGDAK